MSIICIDFDGTCVTHEYPNIGKDIGAVPVLKDWVNRGHKLILWTMRSGRSWKSSDTHIPWSVEFREACEWFVDNDLSLFGFNENPNQSWSTSPKAYANYYVDDSALGCPLKFDPALSDRPFVDWDEVSKLFDEFEKEAEE